MSGLSEADHLQSFIDAMKAAGIVTSDPIIADGKMHRIHVDGDAKGKRNGWYILYMDERPAGSFGCNKRIGSGKENRILWTAKGMTPLTPEEKARFAKEQAERKAKAQAEEAARHAAAKVLANRMWDAAAPGPHPYLTRKGVEACGALVGDWIKVRKDGSEYVISGALLIPVRKGKDIVSMQAIFAKPQGEDGRDRDFIYGGEKRGCWWPIGKPTEVDGRKTILICEGFATGASLHMATGLGVLVAFDAGNLLPVAREMKARRPNDRFIICADNDQWTLSPVRNPGVTKARDAAAVVDTEVAIPVFADLDNRPTDFNDLHAREGLEAVRRQVMAVVEGAPQEAPAEADEPPPHEEVPDYGEPDYAASEAPQEPIEDEAKPKRKGRPKKTDDGSSPRLAEGIDGVIEAEPDNFRVLGHDKDNIYVFPKEMKMVIGRGHSDWSEGAFTSLAPLHVWESRYLGKTKWRLEALNWLQRLAYQRGYYSPNMVRGRGAWRDEGRIVVHLGNKLLVDGEAMGVDEIVSNYVYEQGARLRMPHEEAATREHGQLVLDTAKAFHWSRPASALLVAGWVALAPLCGALRWRPHIWLTGGTGSGKTTVLNEFIWPMMNGMELYAQGNSTEAGIRQSLGSDALAVLFDEAEQNNDREAGRIQAAMALIRQASSESGAKTLKGTQGGDAVNFMIRSMFCLSSVQVGIKHQADVERMAILGLRHKRDSVDPSAAWAAISAALQKFRSVPDLPSRILRRSINQLPITMQNIEVFAKAAADKFGSQREGDQYGALLAGAWSLRNANLVSLESARKAIDQYDWEEFVEASETEESTKALNALVSSLIRTPRGDVQVYELIARAAGREKIDDEDVITHMSVNDARALLRRYGMAVMLEGRGEDGEVLIANQSTELERLMASSPYAADLKGQLARVEGARKHGPIKFNGVTSRAVGIPLRLILDGKVSPPPSDPMGNDIQF